MKGEDLRMIARFMRGDTEDMDLHEWAGDVLRKYITELRDGPPPSPPTKPTKGEWFLVITSGPYDSSCGHSLVRAESADALLASLRAKHPCTGEVTGLDVYQVAATIEAPIAKWHAEEAAAYKATAAYKKERAERAQLDALMRKYGVQEQVCVGTSMSIGKVLIR